MKHKLTPAFVANPPAPSRDRAFYWEGSFGLMVAAKGHKSFVVQYPAGTQSRRMSLKAGLSLQEARREVKKILGDVAKGGDPLGDKRRAAGATLKAVIEEYFKRELPKLRTGGARKLVIERLVLPVMGAGRSTPSSAAKIVRLLDDIEERNGPHQATAVLAFLSKIFNWQHASRDDPVACPARYGARQVRGICPWSRIVRRRDWSRLEAETALRTLRLFGAVPPSDCHAARRGCQYGPQRATRRLALLTISRRWVGARPDHSTSGR
jgi:hypothetical protein